MAAPTRAAMLRDGMIRLPGITAEAVRSHPRRFRDFRYVYPVISRRSGGLSLGINLSPDKKCNFDCAYCQVDRQGGPVPTANVDLGILENELRALIEEVKEAQPTAVPGQACPEAGDPVAIRDIAFSGDGEPTTFARFGECVERVVRVRDELCPASVPIILITNASGLHRLQVRAALGRIDAVWAKLDAGTEDFFRLVCRPSVPFGRILENIQLAACIKPIVIQSMFVRWEGRPPSEAEIGAFAQRLVSIRERGGAIDRVQVYTIARPPADARVSALSDAELEAIASLVRERSGERVESFGSFGLEEEER